MARRGYSTSAWQRAREVALERARRRCQRCGARRHLDVHHLDEQGPAGPRGTDQTNLVVLCHGCHSTEHGGGDRWPPER